MKPGDYDNADDAMAVASKLELRGEWDASVQLYRYLAERWPEHAEYVQQCIDRIAGKQTMAEESQEVSCALEPGGEKAGAAGPDGKARRPRRIRGSVLWALFVLGWDVVFTGWFGMSLIVCPVWLFLAVVKNAIERPGWRLALLRIAIPPLVLFLVMSNEKIQRGVGKANSARVITACDQFYVDTGEYPQSLDELVPQYMPSVPPAKYCMMFGDFMYWNLDGHARLMWCVDPPFGRLIYDFGDQSWTYLD